jgi:hypothetical protein
MDGNSQNLKKRNGKLTEKVKKPRSLISSMMPERCDMT